MKKSDFFTIDFCGDNCQYVRFMQRDGYSLFVGASSDEAAAYEDAISQAFGCSASNASKLPKRRGNARNGYAAYFGRDVATQIRRDGETDLYVYCLIYLKDEQ